MNRSSYSCITKLYLSLTYERASTGEGIIVESNHGWSQASRMDYGLLTLRSVQVAASITGVAFASNQK